MRIILISDTHGRHEQIKIPEGDLLIHAGDITRRGQNEELPPFNDFLGRLPHPKKIIIAGNRDSCFERDPQRCRALLTSALYLQDESVEIGGFRIYGSPWQPPFLDMAFNLPRGEPLRRKWALIPEGIDILITHTPPYGIGDRTMRGESVGDRDLLDAVQRIRPKLHVFGHIHEGYGCWQIGATDFINASVVDSSMQAAFEPIVVDLAQ
jgi:Icc-related predicted phosphoesterase